MTGKHVRVGDRAPAFSLRDATGRPWSLAGLRGKTVVLYFYPRDDTPGCTLEACGFRDAHARFRRAGAVVLGVSADDAASHAKFAAKHRLPFPLLVDAHGRASKAYGAWGEKTFLGRAFCGIKRSTFVIDARGRVALAQYGVNPVGHASTVLETVKKLAAKKKRRVSSRAKA